MSGQPAGGTFEIVVDGRPVAARDGWSVAAALWNAGIAQLRLSRAGRPRGPLCAMGSCFECRVTIDGEPHRRACMEPCSPGLRIATHG